MCKSDVKNYTQVIHLHIPSFMRKESITICLITISVMVMSVGRAVKDGLMKPGMELEWEVKKLGEHQVQELVEHQVHEQGEMQREQERRNWNGSGLKCEVCSECSEKTDTVSDQRNLLPRCEKMQIILKTEK